MRRVFVVGEPGHGTQVVALAAEMGPGVEPVAVVAEAGYGAEPVFIALESGRGVPLIYPAEGQHLLPQVVSSGVGGAPTVAPPDMSLLAPLDHEVLGGLAARWEAVQQTGGDDVAALRSMLDAAMAALDRPWPQPIWSEDVMHKACISAICLCRIDPPSVVGELTRLVSVILDRRWLRGGPGGYFEASTAQETLRVLPIAEKAASEAGPEGQSPAQWAVDPAGRHEFRWWDGTTWTHHVCDQGQFGVDPLT